jgi:hypothetical protein
MAAVKALSPRLRTTKKIPDEKKKSLSFFGDIQSQR